MRFWGVRGSIACPGPDTQRYGGNTSCLEVRCGRRLFIFDAGTGIRELGDRLPDPAPLDADLFLTHTHFDHIVGLPFFRQAFNPANRLRIWAGHLRPQTGVETVLRSMMTPPLFPVPLDIFQARLTYHDFLAGETMEPREGVRIRTAPLNHPNRATGYRVEYRGKAICYITDTEHVVGQPDRIILDLVAGADVMVYDATYTDSEFPNYVSWGHSTWEEGVRLCQAAGVKTLAIFHHLPGRTDADLDVIDAAAARVFAGALVAREGLTLAP
ncbi:MAG: MBL fold metallo-hydrolase [Alphaproteobacteria bacterium]|nr:MBL fold metallo-hydrolase [Alphaproteobacteria bacterium]